MSIKNIKNRALKALMIYVPAAVLCGIFSLIYEHFSHGVYSNFMVWLFLFPLVGGALPFFIIYVFKLAYPNRVALNIYNSGICTLTIGSCMSGVFEIYGSTSALLIVYWIVGICFTAFGLILYMIETIKNSHKQIQNL